jgi:Ca-activated chloride channel family protein
LPAAVARLTRLCAGKHALPQSDRANVLQNRDFQSGTGRASFAGKEKEETPMTLEEVARSRPKRIADRIAVIWIVLAPALALTGLWTGAVDLVSPSLMAAPREPSGETGSFEPRPAVDPNRVGSGELLWKSPDGLVPLPVVDMEVRLEVTGMLVHGTVRQSFDNPTAEVIEAVYLFPLPESAAVHHMEMRIGPRRIVSMIQEREEAKRTYEKARQEGKKAALVEQERPNLFTTSAANINPGESIVVTLEYLQEVEYADGEFGLHFPLTFTPRFVPPSLGSAALQAAARVVPGVHEAGRWIGSVIPDETVVPDWRRITPRFAHARSPSAPRARISAKILPGFPLGDVDCPSHEVRSRWEGDALVIEPVQGTVLADRDFRIRWQPLLGPAPQSALFVEEREDGRYALMMLLPPADDVGDGIGLPTETLFIVDISSSMAGPSIGQAREALVAALERLRPEDTFAILAFNDGIRIYRSDFEQATSGAVSEAQAWARNLEATGGTMIFPALERGLEMVQASRSGRAQRMIFLTDGAVGNEEQVLRSIVANLGPIRLHTIGIGSAPNRYLMRKMAEYGNGLCDFIASTTGAENRLDAFLARLARPVVTELRLVWGGAPPVEVYPSRLPDLHAGEPLFLSAKLPTGGTIGPAVLTGKVVDGEVRIEMPFDVEAPRDSGVATRWARAKVDSLMDSLHEGADPGTVRQTVIAVSLAFHIVSKYTSLVAVEEFPSATGEARTARLANGLPHGSRLLGALPQGGTLEPLLLLIGIALAAAGALLALWLWKGC